jgi:hypothetical protein
LDITLDLENALQNNITNFGKKVVELEAKNTHLEQKNEYLFEKLKLVLSRTFARHTEQRERLGKS